MAEQNLKCPNCGANATNHQNCEYCGSLLVRFVEKGIDLSKTTYMTNDGVFPGLAEELHRNLKLQRENPTEFVKTVFFRELGASSFEECFLTTVLQTGKAAWMDNEPIIDKYGRTNGLNVGFNFEYGISQEFDELNKQQYERFKRLDCFPLFTQRECVNEYGHHVNEFFIDFGEDAEGAAHLLSEIFQKVYSVPLSERLEYYTGVGIQNDENFYQAVARHKNYHGIVEDNNDEDDDEWPWWYYVVGGLILLAISKLFF